MKPIVFDLPNAKSIVVSGDIHGDFTQLVYKCCIQYAMTDTVIIVAGDCGIGKNRAIAIVAACEFGKRFRKTAPEEKPVLKNALAIGDYMMPQLEDLDVEEFWALFLNPKHELLRRYITMSV
ncbi:hypothetical protein SAMN05216463_10133 [Xylanibacter ruminicola]|uniref:Calcineurin-like phosphoesterase domain-containing protein n=1 Tax=Xylanibacter ruminicola TaxID=839 RepID=A0A1M6R1K6_XYLRU|nr:hypothetical protein SAMN05216463_10133 [Xylanibacter ruminicola]